MTDTICRGCGEPVDMSMTVLFLYDGRVAHARCEGTVNAQDRVKRLADYQAEPGPIPGETPRNALRVTGAYCPDCGRIKGVGCACGLTFREKALGIAWFRVKQAE